MQQITVHKKPGWRRAPWAPSVDRIDSSKGYVPGNVRLVCVAANLAMNEWGEDVLARVARAYVEARTGRDWVENIGAL